MAAGESAAGRAVLVTGASQGIGAAIARAFAATPGTRLALAARSRGALEATAGTCRALGAEAEIFLCDVTDAAAVDGLARAVEARFGGVDVLVANAGRFVPGGLADTSPEAFRDMLETNLTSAFLTCRAVVPAMAARGAGRVVLMGSVASVRGYPGGLAYGAAKHGVLGLGRALREETKGTGLGVTVMLPGATVSPSWDGAGVPPARMMPAEDVAAAVVALCGLSARTVPEEVLLRPDAGDL